MVKIYKSVLGSMGKSLVMVLCVFLAVGAVRAGESQGVPIALMGTRFIIHAEGIDEATVQELKAIGEKINQACSDYDIASELSKLNAFPEGDAFTMSPILYEVMSQALELANVTEGAYDPTVGVHTLDWRKSRRTGGLPSEEELEMSRKRVGWQFLQLNHQQKTVVKKVAGMRIDLGGIAKGYAADQMYNYLTQHGFKHVRVVAGGDIRLGKAVDSRKKWSVELMTFSEKRGGGLPVISLENAAISTSGDIHQWIEIAGKRYSHIVDPSTGLGLTKRISATVIAPKSADADALATALCVHPEHAERIRAKVEGMEYLIVRVGENGRKILEKSKGFPDIGRSAD